MTHRPIPTTMQPTDDGSRVPVYGCTCGSVFYVLTNALDHLTAKNQPQKEQPRMAKGVA